MIEYIKESLKLDDFYGKDWRIDVAKGLHQYPRTWKEHKQYTKRRRSWPTH